MARLTNTARITALEKEVAALKKGIEILTAQLAAEHEARVAGEAALSKRLAALAPREPTVFVDDTVPARHIGPDGTS